MATLFADRVRVATATVGTGTVNLGSASAGFRSFAQAVTDGALVSGCTVYYGIQDGNNWECGSGTYTSGSPDTLTRTVVSSSAGGTTTISLSGTAQIAIVLNQLSAVTAVLSGGAIDNTIIGAVTPVAANFTTVGFGSSTSAKINLWGTSYGLGISTSEFCAYTGGNFVFRASYPAGTAYATIASDGINNTVIGNTTPLASTFTTVNANTSLSVGTASATGTQINVNAATSQLKQAVFMTANNNRWILGSNATAESGGNAGSDFFISNYNDAGSLIGSAITITRSTGVVTIAGGLIGTPIGASSPSTGAFTTLSASSGITNTAIGASSPSTGAFTTLSASSGITNTAIGASSPSTGAFTTLSASSGITNTAIGASSPSTGAFTTLSASTSLTAPTMTAGNSSTNVATTAFVATSTDGLYSQSVAGSSNVNLTAANVGNGILVFTGILTGNITVSVPSSVSGRWIVYNNTTGAFTLTFITLSGTGVLITQGGRNQCYTEGTNMYYAVNASATVSIQWTGGTIVANGTYYFTIYAPYAGTILSMDYFTQTSTSFVANVQIAGSSVTSLSAVTVNSATQANTAASAANVFAAGQVISVVISSATSSPTAAVLSLRITKS